MRHLVKELEHLVKIDGRFRYQIEEAAGVAEDTLCRWFHGQPQPNCKGLWGPSLALFDTVLNALGYRLTIERVKEGGMIADTFWQKGRPSRPDRVSWTFGEDGIEVEWQDGEGWHIRRFAWNEIQAAMDMHRVVIGRMQDRVFP
jgi:hypothetical protein